MQNGRVTLKKNGILGEVLISVKENETKGSENRQEEPPVSYSRNTYKIEKR